MIVGVLAFQGDFAEHIAVLQLLRVPSIEVRTIEDLMKVGALIIPGGESTVIAKFLESTGVGREICRRVADTVHPLVVYGTCAGAIVLSKKVTGKNAPRSLRLLDITVDRNAYGTQMDSFETEIGVKGIREKIPVSFIRAPKITRVGKEVEILSAHNEEPVFVRQGNIFASTFHSEMRGSTTIHQLFLQQTALT